MKHLGLWLICVGVAVMISASLLNGSSIRIGQWLMLIGALGLVILRVTNPKDSP